MSLVTELYLRVQYSHPETKKESILSVSVLFFLQRRLFAFRDFACGWHVKLVDVLINFSACSGMIFMKKTHTIKFVIFNSAMCLTMANVPHGVSQKRRFDSFLESAFLCPTCQFCVILEKRALSEAIVFQSYGSFLFC